MNMDIFKDFLSLTDSDRSAIPAILKEIEELLGNSEYSHQRIVYLEELRDLVGIEDGFKEPSVEKPLNREQYISILTKGILKAWTEQDVNFEQVLRLTHSIDEMRAFTDALSEMNPNELADCWRDALLIPFSVRGGIFRRNVNFIVADDIDDVRHTFARFLDLYKMDIAEGFIDNHLRLILGDDYDIRLIEASDGVDFETKLKSSYKSNLRDYHVCFVDEDMPRKRGTAAISSVSRELKNEPDARRVKFVSYTQKQDLDISEEIARQAGADLFLKKTGLSDFYEELITIFENLVLESSENQTRALNSIDGKIILSVIGVNSDNTFDSLEKAGEYLNFRYVNEVWSNEISAGERNRFWINADTDDRFSIHLGMYINTEQGLKLIGCARVVTSDVKPQFAYINDAVMNSDYEILWGDSSSIRNDNEIRIDKFYLDVENNPSEYADLLLQFALAHAINAKASVINAKLPVSLQSLAENIGFSKQAEQLYQLNPDAICNQFINRIEKMLDMMNSGVTDFVETLLRSNQT